MKKKIIGLFCFSTMFLVGISVQSFAAGIEENNEQTADEVNIDEVKVSKVEEVEEDTDIKQIGDTEYSSSDNLSDIGDVSIETELVANDIAVPLYPTFENEQDAVKKITDSCSTVLTQLSKVYNLDALSAENWGEYYYDMFAYLDEPNKVDWYVEDNDEFVKLNCFLDIYENSFKNDFIADEVEDLENTEDLLQNSNVLDTLPINNADEFVEEVGEKVGKSYNSNLQAINGNYKLSNLSLNNSVSTPNLLKVSTSYNKSSAISYAKTYAKSPNSDYGYISGHDCTNFCSQILVAGGKTMNSSWKTYKKALVLWKYTAAWSNANNFAIYWGVDKSYSTFKSFSANVSKGDFICFDKQNDGDWDHFGFVAAKGKYRSDKGYTNFRVAQHSSNYLNWVTAEKNGWENIKSNYPKAIFGIVTP